MKSKDYWKEYRIRNKDKLQTYERARMKRRYAKKKAARKDLCETVAIETLSGAGPIVNVKRRCMTSFCNSMETKQFEVEGMKVWLCKDHSRTP